MKQYNRIMLDKGGKYIQNLPKNSNIGFTKFHYLQVLVICTN